MIATIFFSLSAFASFVAAICWFKAATAYYPAPPHKDDAVGVFFDGSVVIAVGRKHVKRAMLYQTLELQSRWNAKGAIAAAIAALFTVMAMIFST